MLVFLHPCKFSLSPPFTPLFCYFKPMKLLQHSLIIGSIALFPSLSFSCDEHSKSVEEKFINNGDVSGVTKEEFHEAIDKVIDIYRPIIEDTGNTLIVKKDWNNLKDSSYTKREGLDQKQWLISIHGRDARFKNSSKDAVSYVVCHELGHHFGGAPLKKTFGSDDSWAVSEGQSDYWAMNKCLRRVFKKDNNREFVKKLNVTSEVREKCKVFTVTEERAICQRMMVAIEQTYFVQEFSALLFSRDHTEVEQTYTEHPNAQCRVETLVAGTLCGIDLYYKNDNNSELNGNCNPFNGPAVGQRPSCWFKPAPYRPTEESFSDEGMKAHIKNDHYDLLNYMLRTKKIDVNRLYENERNALMIAMSTSSNKSINLFLAQKDLDINHTDEIGNTALHYASNFREAEALFKLLEFPEIDINVQSQNGSTPLMISAYRGYPSMVKALVDRNEINLTLKNEKGMMALDFAKLTDILSDEKVEIIQSKLSQ